MQTTRDVPTVVMNRRDISIFYRSAKERIFFNFFNLTVPNQKYVHTKKRHSTKRVYTKTMRFEIKPV